VKRRDAALRVVAPEFRKRLALDGRLHGVVALNGRSGSKARDATNYALGVAAATIDHSTVEDSIETWYPFYYKPLVEFALRLPPALLIQPGCQKVILRQAMTGILPESVRTRADKAGLGARVRWALTHEAATIDRLLHDSLVVEHGWVDQKALRRQVRAIREGRSRRSFELLTVLALETWLRMRSNQWTGT